MDLVNTMQAFRLYLLNKIPAWRWLDNAYLWSKFIRTHGRMPERTGGHLNDVIFRMLVGREIENPFRAIVSDKELVKLIVKARIGAAYNVPTIEVLRSLEEARRYKFPDFCVVKPTHMSGQVFFFIPGKTIPERLIKDWFSRSFYKETREQNYRFLLPKIIVEPYIFGTRDPIDYKFFCVNEKVRLIQTDHSRSKHHTQMIYSRDWTALNFCLSSELGKITPPPNNLSKLIEVAEQMSSGFNFVRIDLYTDGKTIFVGEITNAHQAGLGRFVPRSAEALCTGYLFEGDEPPL